jgi:hypothetical protein
VSSRALAPETYLRAPAAIVQINVSDGGVPKLPIGRAIVDELGIVGDRHRDVKHHGGVSGRCACTRRS